MRLRKWLVLSLFILSSISSLSASILKIPSTTDEKKELHYKDLTCTPEDRQYVSEIITTMAQNGKLSLLTKKGDLQQLGSQITKLHPLKFLAIIFSSPTLKTHMLNIVNDYFKRNGLMGGLGPSLEIAADKWELEGYKDHIEGFAAEVNIPVEDIRPFFEARAWEDLVKYLTNVETEY